VDELDPREAARAKRRDRAAEAQHREPMNPGMGKVFKQIGDVQAKAAKAAKAAQRKVTEKRKTAQRKTAKRRTAKQGAKRR
jgi:hypothetical protein